MKFARKDGKLWGYLLLFTIMTAILLIIGTNNLYSYLIFILFSLYGLKCITKIKTSLYDMMTLTIMLLIKLVIEFIFMIKCNWWYYD